MVRREELQIRLVELQVGAQRRTAEYFTYISLILSSMIVVVFTLYTWAITVENLSYVQIALVVMFGLFLLAILTITHYSKQLDMLELQIQELKKQYCW